MNKKDLNENNKIKHDVEELKKKIRQLATTKIKVFVNVIRRLIG